MHRPPSLRTCFRTDAAAALAITGHTLLSFVTVAAHVDCMSWAEFMTAVTVRLEGDSEEHTPRRMVLNGATRWLTHWRMFRHARENRRAIENITKCTPDRAKELLGELLVRHCVPVRVSVLLGVS